MAAPAEVSERRSNFRIKQFQEKHLFNIAANLTLNTMASFVILLTVRTARIACSDRHTYRQTDRTTTVTLSAHACRGLIIIICTKQEELGDEARFPIVITTVQCSGCSQLSNKHRVVTLDVTAEVNPSAILACKCTFGVLWKCHSNSTGYCTL